MKRGWVRQTGAQPSAVQPGPVFRASYTSLVTARTQELDKSNGWRVGSVGVRKKMGASETGEVFEQVTACRS